MTCPDPDPEAPFRELETQAADLGYMLVKRVPANRDYVAPIFVDGPLKGQHLVLPPEQMSRPFMWRGSDATFDRPLMYHFHPFALLGNGIWLASMQPIFQAIPHEAFKDAFQVIVTPRAKEAMYP